MAVTCTQLDPSIIRTDGGTQPRAELDQSRVEYLAGLLREGIAFRDPIVVFYDGADYWLADGFHRLAAIILAMTHIVDADIRQGTQRDAILYSIEANTRHGMPLALSDRKRGAIKLLEDPEWSGWSDREIGRRCGLNHETVGKLRQELSGGNRQLTRTVERNGSEYTIVLPTNNRQPPERALVYAEEINQRAEDAWFKDRGLDKEQPEAQEALHAFIEQNIEDGEDEDEEWEPRYNGEHAAYCKYCYKTHKKWQLGEDAWLCEYCNHRTTDQFMQIEDVEPSEAQKDFYRRHSVPTALLSSESNEWFTPPQYVDTARELMGGIDLDPASNAYANEKVVQATTYYDIQTNGLDKPWNGRVWLNPPYGRDEGGSNQEAWSRRLIEQYEAGITKEAVLLVNANTEAKWFQPLYNYLICFTNHRIRFYNTEGTPSQPTQGNAFIYFGNQPDRFTELFSAFGVVIRRIDK